MNIMTTTEKTLVRRALLDICSESYDNCDGVRTFGRLASDAGCRRFRSVDRRLRGRHRRRRNGMDRLTKALMCHAEEEITFTATVTGDAEGIELGRHCLTQKDRTAGLHAIPIGLLSCANRMPPRIGS
jgi:hypothetical protein